MSRLSAHLPSHQTSTQGGGAAESSASVQGGGSAWALWQALCRQVSLHSSICPSDANGPPDPCPELKGCLGTSNQTAARRQRDQPPLGQLRRSPASPMHTHPLLRLQCRRPVRDLVLLLLVQTEGTQLLLEVSGPEGSSRPAPTGRPRGGGAPVSHTAGQAQVLTPRHTSPPPQFTESPRWGRARPPKT